MRAVTMGVAMGSAPAARVRVGASTWRGASGGRNLGPNGGGRARFQTGLGLIALFVVVVIHWLRALFTSV